MDVPEADGNDDARLYKDALDLSVDKVISDIETLLAWLQATEDLEERRRHADHAIDLLKEMRENLDKAIEVRKLRAGRPEESHGD